MVALKGKFKKQIFIRIILILVLIILISVFYISNLNNETFGNSNNPIIKLTISIPNTNDLSGIIYDPLNHYIYIDYPGMISIINDRTNKIIQNISLEKLHGNIQVPLNMAYDFLNNTIYINTLFYKIIIINCSTNKIESEFNNIGFSSMAYDKNNNILYISFSNNSIAVINGSSNTVMKWIYIGISGPMVYDPNNDDLYVANSWISFQNLSQNSHVDVINCKNYSVIKSIEVGIAPIAMEYDTSNGDIYVVNTYSGNISVIDSYNNMISESINISEKNNNGTGPVAISYDSLNGYIFVLNSYPSTLTLINANNNSIAGKIILSENNASTGMVFDPSNGFLYVISSNDTQSFIFIISFGNMFNNTFSLFLEIAIPVAVIIIAILVVIKKIKK